MLNGPHFVYLNVSLSVEICKYIPCISECLKEIIWRMFSPKVGTAMSAFDSPVTASRDVSHGK